MADDGINQTKEAADGLNTSLKDLASQMERLAAHKFGQKLLDSLDKSAQSASDLGTHLGNIVKNGKDLPKNIKSAADLQKAMLGSSKLFEKVQKSILATQKEKLEKYDAVALEKLESQLDLMKDMENKAKLQNKTKEGIAKIRKNATNSLETQLKTLKDQETTWEKIRNKIEKVVEELELADKLARLFTKSLTGTIMAGSASAAADALTAPLEGLMNMIPVAGTMVNGLIKLFKFGFFAQWDQMERLILPINQIMAKQFGEMGGKLSALSVEAKRVTDRFESMGQGMGVVAGQAVVKFAAALKDTEFAFFADGLEHIEKKAERTQAQMKKLSDFAIYTSQVLGLTAGESAKLAVSFSQAGLNSNKLTAGLMKASAAASEIGVPVNQVLQDIIQLPEVLQRFGVSNLFEFSKSAAIARVYGTTIDKIAESVKSLDTFEGAATAAAKFNAIMGTSVNALDVFMEDDPVKKLAHFQKAMKSTEKSWDNLSHKTRVAIMDTLNMTDEVAKATFSQRTLSMSQEDMNKAMDAASKSELANVRSKKRWGRATQDLRQQLLNFKKEMVELGKEITNTMSKIFFGKELNPSEWAGKLKVLIRGITQDIKDWHTKGGIETLKAGFKEMVPHVIKFADSIARIADSLQKMDDSGILESFKSIGGSISTAASMTFTPSDVVGTWRNLLGFGAGDGPVTPNSSNVTPKGVTPTNSPVTPNSSNVTPKGVTPTNSSAPNSHNWVEQGSSRSKGSSPQSRTIVLPPQTMIVQVDGKELVRAMTNEMIYADG